MELPYELKTAIADELAGGVPARAAAALSERYRSGKPAISGYIADAGDAAAYAAARMPATYAATHAVLRETARRLPGFQPKRLLDAGAGTGAASWAAAVVWPGLEEVTLLERDSHMTELGKRLAARSPSPALHGGRWMRADLTGDWNADKADIAVLCYALGELPEEKQQSVVQKLWDAAEALVVVEPGTQTGFSRILGVRTMLLDSSAHIAAPCPGNITCPEADGWCHFSARVARNRLHRQMKGAELPYEDEKYSYLVATKAECKPCAARVLRHPTVLNRHILVHLCTSVGSDQITVSKRMGDIYRRARNLKWGDDMGIWS